MSYSIELAKLYGQYNEVKWPVRYSTPMTVAQRKEMLERLNFLARLAIAERLEAMACLLEVGLNFWWNSTINSAETPERATELRKFRDEAEATRRRHDSREPQGVPRFPKPKGVAGE